MMVTCEITLDTIAPIHDVEILDHDVVWYAKAYQIADKVHFVDVDKSTAKRWIRVMKQFDTVQAEIMQAIALANRQNGIPISDEE